MHIEKNLKAIRQLIVNEAEKTHRNPNDILLVAVSKGQPLSKIREAYDLGVRDFAENRVKEALIKMGALPSDIRWHFIGKIQKNKVSKILGKFHLIHSIDSIELAKKIAQLGFQRDMRTQILLEANTSGEKSKGGLTPEEWLFHFKELSTLTGIVIQGVMTMAPLTENEHLIRHCFAELKRLQRSLQNFDQNIKMLSMGMSQDFPLAIQEGATILRLGTALFGISNET